MSETVLEESGKASIGFRQSEKRLCPGGTVWRRTNPHQPSREFGSNYESWDCSGDAASNLARIIRGTAGRPSRVDVAFDFQCDDATTPDRLIEMIRAHVEALGISIGISGQDGRNTRYVGSASSPRRIRIYRKDWQDPEYALLFGPTMRIELVLRAEHAHAWWKVWSVDEAEAFEVAAGHMARMMGVRVQEVLADVPTIEAPPAASEVVRLDQFLFQHGAAIAAYALAGIPLVEMAIERERLTTCRKRRYRLRKRVEEIKEGWPLQEHPPECFCKRCRG